MNNKEWIELEKQKCKAKVPYQTITEAVWAKKTVNRALHRIMKIYRCPHCKSLHLTTIKKRKEKSNNGKHYNKRRTILM